MISNITDSDKNWYIDSRWATTCFVMENWLEICKGVMILIEFCDENWFLAIYKGVMILII